MKKNAKGESTTKTTEIKETIRGYFESIYSSKFENLEEMDRFLDTYDHPKLKQEDINHLNRSITQNEIEAAIKSPPKKKSPEPDGFTAEFYQMSKQELIPTCLKLFHEMEKEGRLPNCFVKTIILSHQNQTKTPRKRRTVLEFPLMNIDAKIFNKIMANQIQQHIRKIIYNDQVNFIPRMQGWFNIYKSINVIQHINISKNKTTWSSQ
jgi:hypothetical protein